ncbi:hypothetical protein TSUD_129310 [Trifolium subterraneum]|uniref:CCHC-type domain-containing protein n=1 Tax=Trifolium subterraneum TaxID=3900 RepID=A0A2Z6PIG5_TRISU|nr:hypothetical protein TSUD_129310 [Trifolium subterraneum]
MSNPLLSFVTDEHEAPKDVQDNIDRSSKKVKGNNHMMVEEDQRTNTDMAMNMSKSREGEGKGDQRLTTARTYRATVLGTDGPLKDQLGTNILVSSDEEELDDYEDDENSITVEEMQVAGHDCPIFHLSKKEELCIQKPCKRGIIVKMLGRRIGYKALENRLKQMWVKAGVINIVYLGNDYFLVTFTSQEDQYRALTNGPWMIYDHYLTVREWCPNFNSSENHMKTVNVWVRFSGLPIEFYDAKVLTSIGNRIGRTIKVDKNTLLQERGKYARLCVEVDLLKPLLAMFTVKGRTYKVEYEGLHLLCLGCGNFGHYVEGCPAKVNGASDERRKNTEAKQGEGSGDRETGPWTVVSKPRRQRKQTKPVEENKGETTNMGSRFAILGENQNDQDGEIPIENDEELVSTNKETVGTMP